MKRIGSGFSLLTKFENLFINDSMKRINIKEFHETKYCPGVWRDLMTDFLSVFTYNANPYKIIFPFLKNAISRSGSRKIIDFGSGGGTYMLKLLQEIDPNSESYTAELTDKFPNKQCFQRIETLSGGRIKYNRESVDLLEGGKPQGFWTFFSTAHHFNKKELKTLLETAVKQKCGIGIFEYSSREILQIVLPSLMVPFLVLAVTPLITPFSWRRLFWTYILPVVPTLVMVDGFISHMKSYSVAELEKIASETASLDYHFECGRKRIFLKTCPITYLTGYPINK